MARPLPGFAARDADVVVHSAVRQPVTWKGKGDVGSLAGKPVRVRFHLRNGKLYAFQFVA